MVMVVTEEGWNDVQSLPIDLLRRAGEMVLESEVPNGKWSVTVMLTTDDKMRQLNQQFNGTDSVTDVLSFNHTEGWNNGILNTDATEHPETESGYLGDIAICVAQAQKQAEQQNYELERELAMLTIHGTLHLLGYDHADKEEEQVMFGKTDVFMRHLFEAEQETA